MAKCLEGTKVVIIEKDSIFPKLTSRSPRYGRSDGEGGNSAICGKIENLPQMALWCYLR